MILNCPNQPLFCKLVVLRFFHRSEEDVFFGNGVATFVALLGGYVSFFASATTNELTTCPPQLLSYLYRIHHLDKLSETPCPYPRVSCTSFCRTPRRSFEPKFLNILTYYTNGIEEIL